MRHSSVRRGLAATLVVASFALTACGSDSKAADTTAAPTTAGGAETTAGEEEPPTVTNAPAEAAEVTGGKATITVAVGTDDFTTKGGTRVVSVPKGTEVTVELTDPNADQEYHLHGYDVEVAAAKGATGKINFVADQTGSFDVESHDTEQVLLVIVVL
jgi:hypothetical protein